MNKQAILQYLSDEHNGTGFLMRKINIRFLATDLLDDKLSEQDRKVIEDKLIEASRELLEDQTAYICALSAMLSEASKQDSR